jgi:hypothetical protein
MFIALVWSSIAAVGGVAAVVIVVALMLSRKRGASAAGPVRPHAQRAASGAIFIPLSPHAVSHVPFFPIYMYLTNLNYTLPGPLAPLFYLTLAGSSLEHEREERSFTLTQRAR